MNESSSTIRRELAQGRSVVLTTKGTSMQPLLFEGKTFVTVVPLKRELRVLDLLLCQLPDGRYLLHRMIGRDGSCIRTRGDNCLSQERIPEDDVLGIVTAITRNGKTIRVTDRRYRLYAAFRVWSYPVRAPLKRARFAAGRIFRKMKHGGTL